ncbi:hypothetical protein RJ641_027282 [Dillenia turbinata]|uniref:Uncharacterized protein n=1 Tax=Dillenia turbinata TaxID=194707 RepID=A0AAN8VY00_9MAGN
MGRGGGKAKKQTLAGNEDHRSGGEEKVPAYRRRGRPQKPLKDEIEEEENEEMEKVEEEDGEILKSTVTSKDTKSQAVKETGGKRKRSSQVKEGSDSVKEENGLSNKSSTDDSTKSIGCRQNGSRRKSKPRRAAEAGVECKLINSMIMLATQGACS